MVRGGIARRAGQLASDARQLNGQARSGAARVLLGCGLRRAELVALTIDHLQQRDGRWGLPRPGGQGKAADAGIETKIGCHSFRATGITEYLRNGGKLEIAQQMANHESARTTGLYVRRNDQVSLDEVERILI